MKNSTQVTLALTICTILTGAGLLEGQDTNQPLYFIINDYTRGRTTMSMVLHVDGNRIKNVADATVYLRGWNHESGVESDSFKWSTYEYLDLTTLGLTLDAYVAYGANVLRRHMVVQSWLNNVNCNTSDGVHTYKWCWDKILTEAESRGIYVIVDPAKVTKWTSGENDQLGYDNYTNADSRGIVTTQSAFTDFVASIVTELGSHDNLIMEVWNEPLFNYTGNTYGLLYQTVWNQAITKIRATEASNGYNTHLILCCLKASLQYWDLTDEISNLNWITGYPLTDSANKLAYGTHAYRSYGSVGGTVYPYSDAPYDYLTLKNIYTQEGLKAASDNYPIVIGEIGCLNTSADAAWMYNTLRIFNEWNIGYVAWTWRQDGGAYAQVATGTEATTGGTLNSYGLITKDAIAYVAPEPEEPIPPVPPPPASYYYVNTSSAGNGQTNPSGLTQKTVGQTFTAVASPNIDYGFSLWKRDTLTVGTNPTYNMTDGQKDVTYNLIAYFVANPPTTPDPPTAPPAGYFAVNIGTPVGGTVSLTGQQELLAGETLTVEVTSIKNNYRFNYWLLDGSNWGTNQTFTLTGTADTTYTLLPVFQYVTPPPQGDLIMPSSDNLGNISRGNLERYFKDTKKVAPINLGDVLKNLKKMKI